MFRRFIFSFVLLEFFVSNRAFGQNETTLTLEVDANDRGKPLTAVWPYFGYDEANYTTTDEGRALLSALSAAHSSKIHIRTHFLLNSGDGTPSLKWSSTNLYSEDAAGYPIYDFSIIDGVMDATLESGAWPLFEIGFMPKALSSHPEPYENSSTFTLDGGSFYPPRDHERWAELITAWAEHVSDRYDGGGSQTNWLWELWNEPDIGYFKGTVADYARLYDYTEAALHAVFPDAVLGGPAVASPEREFLAEFLEHCASGTNAVTGLSGARLDLVTFHAKGGVTSIDDHVQMDLGNQLRLHRMGFETVKSSSFANTPVLISEADPDGCAACPSSTHRYLDYRNSPAYGAYEVAMMKRSLELAEQMDVDLRGVLTWAFTFPGTPYFAGYRALTTNGVHLPVLNAFKLLGRLAGTRVPVRSQGARTLSELLENGVREQPEIDGLAAKTGDEIRVLVWNYHDDLVNTEPSSVMVRVSVPVSFGEILAVTHERVDEAHGNAFTVWQSQGSPETPSSIERQALLRAMDDLEFEAPRTLQVESGFAQISFELPRFGVSLLTLKPQRAEDTTSRAEGCSCRTTRPQASSPSLLFGAIMLAATRVRRSFHSRPAAARGAARRCRDLS